MRARRARAHLTKAGALLRSPEVAALAESPGTSVNRDPDGGSLLSELAALRPASLGLEQLAEHRRDLSAFVPRAHLRERAGPEDLRERGWHSRNSRRSWRRTRTRAT